MISHATPEFWACFEKLPTRVQAHAKAAYALWTADSHHPSLHFKPVWSVRIGIHWRALGTKCGNEMIWFWIGSHADYDRVVG